METLIGMLTILGLEKSVHIHALPGVDQAEFVYDVSH